MLDVVMLNVVLLCIVEPFTGMSYICENGHSGAWRGDVLELFPKIEVSRKKSRHEHSNFLPSATNFTFYSSNLRL